MLSAARISLPRPGQEWITRGASRSKYTLAALIKVSRRPRHARYRPWFSLFDNLSVGILRRYQFSGGALLAPGAEEDTSVVGKQPHQLRTRRHHQRRSVAAIPA